MKKIVLAMSTAAVLSAAAHAGSMGPVSMASYTPYLTGEASYTWPQISTPLINNRPSTSSSQGWGGRLGGGMMYGFSEKLSFTGEIGGGYYGGKDQSSTVGTFKQTIDGYDILAGAIYKWNYFDIFLQGGFMMENLRTSSSINLAHYTTGGFVKGMAKNNTNMTQALPEIKVGGIYNYNPNWGISVAYMHVFGGNWSFAHDAMATSTSGYNVSNSNSMQNPTLDSVMFGLHYNFMM